MQYFQNFNFDLISFQSIYSEINQIMLENNNIIEVCHKKKSIYFPLYAKYLGYNKSIIHCVYKDKKHCDLTLLRKNNFLFKSLEISPLVMKLVFFIIFVYVLYLSIRLNH